MFDELFKMIVEDVSPFEKDNYPKGIIFLLPAADRPADLPPLPEEMSKSRFWHTGVIYDGQAYETFNHARNSVANANDRLSDPMFKNVVYAAYPVNVSKLMSELDSGTDCATYVGRILGLSKTVGYEKDPKVWPDTIFEYLKSEGLRFHRGVSELKDRRQAVS